MREVSLESWEDVLERVESITRSLEQIYDAELVSSLETVGLGRVFPTEEFLENDKLALVLKQVFTKGYNVPIVVVERDTDYFVLDGHHRCYVFRKLQHDTASAYIIRFPVGRQYRDVPKRSIEDLPIKEVSPIEDPILRAWQRTFSILKHYEAIYAVSFYLRKDHVKIADLVPTQSHVGRMQVEAIKQLLVPITCVQHLDRYYILDGHARAVRARQLGQEAVDVMVLVPAVPIGFGIVKTAEEMNFRGMDDLKIRE